MKIRKSHANINMVLLVLILLLTVVGTSNQSLRPQIKLETPKSSAGEITIVTPENITYTGPMSGYYPATAGFESDEDGSIPKELTYVSGGVAGTGQIVSEVKGHKKVAELVDSSAVEFPHLSEYPDQVEGTFECWIYKQSGSSAVVISLRVNVASLLCLEIFVDRQNNGKFEYLHSGGITEFGAGLYQDQTWYHLRVGFDCVTETANISLNGQLEVSGINFDNPGDYISQILFRTHYS